MRCGTLRTRAALLEHMVAALSRLARQVSSVTHVHGHHVRHALMLEQLNALIEARADRAMTLSVRHVRHLMRNPMLAAIHPELPVLLLQEVMAGLQKSSRSCCKSVSLHARPHHKEAGPLSAREAEDEVAALRRDCCVALVCAGYPVWAAHVVEPDRLAQVVRAVMMNTQQKEMTVMRAGEGGQTDGCDDSDETVRCAWALIEALPLHCLLPSATMKHQQQQQQHFTNDSQNDNQQRSQERCSSDNSMSGKECCPSSSHVSVSFSSDQPSTRPSCHVHSRHDDTPVWLAGVAEAVTVCARAHEPADETRMRWLEALFVLLAHPAEDVGPPPPNRNTNAGPSERRSHSNRVHETHDGAEGACAHHDDKDACVAATASKRNDPSRASLTSFSPCHIRCNTTATHSDWLVLCRAAIQYAHDESANNHNHNRNPNKAVNAYMCKGTMSSMSVSCNQGSMATIGAAVHFIGAHASAAALRACACDGATLRHIPVSLLSSYLAVTPPTAWQHTCRTVTRYHDTRQQSACNAEGTAFIDTASAQAGRALTRARVPLARVMHMLHRCSQPQAILDLFYGTNSHSSDSINANSIGKSINNSTRIMVMDSNSVIDRISDNDNTHCMATCNANAHSASSSLCLSSEANPHAHADPAFPRDMTQQNDGMHARTTRSNHVVGGAATMPCSARVHVSAHQIDTWLTATGEAVDAADVRHPALVNYVLVALIQLGHMQQAKAMYAGVVAAAAAAVAECVSLTADKRAESPMMLQPTWRRVRVVNVYTHICVAEALAWPRAQQTNHAHVKTNQLVDSYDWCHEAFTRACAAMPPYCSEPHDSHPQQHEPQQHEGSVSETSGVEKKRLPLCSRESKAVEHVKCVSVSSWAAHHMHGTTINDTNDKGTRMCNDSCYYYMSDMCRPHADAYHGDDNPCPSHDAAPHDSHAYSNVHVCVEEENEETIQGAEAVRGDPSRPPAQPLFRRLARVARRLVWWSAQRNDVARVWAVSWDARRLDRASGLTRASPSGPSTRGMTALLGIAAGLVRRAQMHATYHADDAVDGAPKREASSQRRHPVCDAPSYTFTIAVSTETRVSVPTPEPNESVCDLYHDLCNFCSVNISNSKNSSCRQSSDAVFRPVPLLCCALALYAHLGEGRPETNGKSEHHAVLDALVTALRVALASSQPAMDEMMQSLVRYDRALDAAMRVRTLAHTQQGERDDDSRRADCGDDRSRLRRINSKTRSSSNQDDYSHDKPGSQLVTWLECDEKAWRGEWPCNVHHITRVVLNLVRGLGPRRQDGWKDYLYVLQRLSSTEDGRLSMARAAPLMIAAGISPDIAIHFLPG